MWQVAVREGWGMGMGDEAHGKKGGGKRKEKTYRDG